MSRCRSGPFFKAYLANLLPGQFLQPFVDAAFSDLGLDPNVLLPSQRPTRRPVSPPPRAAGAYPRTGQGGDPHLTLPDAITGNPGDRRAVYPASRCPAPVVTRTASLCRRRRRAGRHRDRRRGAARLQSTPNRPRRRSWCPRPVRCRRLAARGGRHDAHRTDRRWPSPWCWLWSAASFVVLRSVERSTAPTSSPTSTTATASSPATTSASSVFRSARIDAIEPQPDRVKISFWFDDKYKVPADAKAAILSPSLVTARAIQLTPAYTGGPMMGDDAVIPQKRTAVPVEWDDLREQLEKLTETLQPTEPGGVSTLGAFINTAADNLRGQGTNIRDTVIKLSQAFSALGDHSNDIFSTVKNLSMLVSALQDSADLMRQLNQNLAAVTGLLANDPDEVANAVRDLNAVVGDVQSFVADNREALGTTSDKLASVSQALADSLDDIKQTLHVAPTTFSELRQHLPARPGRAHRMPCINNFANPISFLCGAIQAASRLGAEQSAKLCVQYLAPIIKNRQYNFPPLGRTSWSAPRRGPTSHLQRGLDAARLHSAAPSADRRLRRRRATCRRHPPGPPLAAEAPVATDPADGLHGMMVPPGGGS